MEILSIRLKSKTNSNVFIVETDNGEFVLHSDAIVKYNISKGQVDEEKFNLGLDLSQTLIAMELATKYLTGKIKTEKQLKNYLYKKGFHKKTVESVLIKLKEYHLIDDSLYAQSYISSNKNFSKNKLKQKLTQAGVDKNIILEQTDGIDDFMTCLNHAKKFMKTKEATKQNADKLIRHLCSKGYNFDTIKKVLNELKCEDNDDWNWYGKNLSIWPLDRTRV